MTPSPQSQEIFDVVDELDRVVRQETRSTVHREKLLHRAVHIFVLNPGGQIYLQKRSPHKDQLPNCWTTSCSGHVDCGEDYDTAARRELGEELDIHLQDGDELPLLFKYDACRRTGWEFVQVYLLVWAGAVRFDPVEISEGRWLEREALQSWVEEQPRAFAPSFRLLWQEARDRLLI